MPIIPKTELPKSYGLIRIMHTKSMNLRTKQFMDLVRTTTVSYTHLEVKLPVPKTWTGELDAWYINDQGTVTYMDREKEDTEGYYTFQTDHFSLYALSVSEPREEEKADEKKDEEQTAKQNLDAGNDAAVYETVKDMAEAYYGEDATDPHSVGGIVANRYDSLGNEIKAGDVLTFRISYHSVSYTHLDVYKRQTSP